MKPRTLPLLVIAVASSACFAAREVRPVGEGNFATGLSVGGPLFTNLGGAIPTPLATAYGRYGLTAKTDVDFGLTLPTIAAVALDAGAAHLVLEQDGKIPAVMVGGRLTLWGNLDGFTSRLDANGLKYSVNPELFEEVYSYASWRLAPRWIWYAGLDLFAQLQDKDVRPTVLAGIEWRAARVFGLQLELKQMAFTYDEKFATVSFIGPGDYGALSVNLGFNFYPGAAP